MAEIALILGLISAVGVGYCVLTLSTLVSRVEKLEVFKPPFEQPKYSDN